MKIRFKITKVVLDDGVEQAIKNFYYGTWFNYLIKLIKARSLEQSGRIFEVLKRGDDEIIRVTHTSNGNTSDSIEITNGKYFDFYFTSSRKSMAVVTVTFRTTGGEIIIHGKFSEVIEAPFGDFDDHGVFQIKLGN